jgi:hypothetical protein
MSKNIEHEKNFQKSDSFSLTMMPGGFAKKLRTCVIYQFIRFLIINLKMLVVVRKSH